LWAGTLAELAVGVASIARFDCALSFAKNAAGKAQKRQSAICHGTLNVDPVSVAMAPQLQNQG
jgi:hypothetical protein